MSKQFDAFIAGCEKAVSSEKAPLSPEFLAAAKTVGEKVEAWGLEHGLMTQKSLPKGGKFFAALESFETGSIEQSLGPQAVADLIAEIGIPKCYEKDAAKKVATVLCQVLGKDGAIAFADYSMNDPELKGDVRSLEGLFGSDLWARVTPGTEAFGINMDRVTPDLKTILTVALMQFHVSLTPRVMPIQSVTQSNIQITREMMDVFDMSKPDDPPTRVVDLYRDPTMVNTNAIRIEPIAENDPNKGTDAAHLVADVPSTYAFEQEINLFKLAQDTERPGYDKFNHTDIIEDGIAMDAIVIEVTKGEKSEKFLVKLDPNKARLTQVPNDYRSTERRMTFDRTTIVLNAGTAVYGTDAASEILADFPVSGGVFLAVTPHVSAYVDRKTGAAWAEAWGAPMVRAIDGSKQDQTKAKDYTVKYLGYQLDARYNEDNKRKTSIRIEINRRNMSYELPAGRNFVIDFAIGQEGAVNAAARLAQVEHIGRDGKNLNIIRGVLERVHDQRKALGNSAQANTEIAVTYAAGDMVHQTAYTSPIDFGSGFMTIRSSDAEGDIKQFLKLRLNKVVTGLLATSLLQQQLATGTQVTFRMITSPYILGAVLSCHHIHAHLDALDQRGAGPVEYVINLDCGAKLEVVTTTFTEMNNIIMIIPYFESAPTSVLNFATDYDQGTLVGAITLGADAQAAHNRMFSVTRECPIPTNVVGAVMEVTGLGGQDVGLDFDGLVAPTFDDPNGPTPPAPTPDEGAGEETP